MVDGKDFIHAHANKDYLSAGYLVGTLPEHTTLVTHLAEEDVQRCRALSAAPSGECGACNADLQPGHCGHLKSGLDVAGTLLFAASSYSRPKQGYPTDNHGLVLPWRALLP